MQSTNSVFVSDFNRLNYNIQAKNSCTLNHTGQTCRLRERKKERQIILCVLSNKAFSITHEIKDSPFILYDANTCNYKCTLSIVQCTSAPPSAALYLVVCKKKTKNEEFSAKSMLLKYTYTQKIQLRLEGTSKGVLV